MKNKILLFAFVTVMGFSLIYEPIQDSIDIIAGATNSTYNVNIDQTAGVTQLNPNGDDDDDDDDEYDDD